MLNLERCDGKCSPLSKILGCPWFMNSQIDERTSDVEALAKIAKTEPQLAYAAYVYGTSKRWCFVSRTAPNIAEHIIYQGCSNKNNSTCGSKNWSHLCTS